MPLFFARSRINLTLRSTNNRQFLFDILQKLARNAKGFAVAAQGGSRVRIAMIIRAAAEEQAVLCGKALQAAVYLLGMGGIDGLKPCQPIILKLGDKGGDLFKVWVRAGRVGKHCQTVGLGNSGDYFVRLGFDLFHKGGSAVF